MSQRKSLRKKDRFDVFKRDDFVCQYCGKTPPSVVLEIDHVHPVSKGGTNDPDNLVTACMDCNRGKGAGSLSSIPEALARKAEIAQEREEQRKALERVVRNKRQSRNRSVGRIEAVFQQQFPLDQFTGPFRSSVRRFLDDLLEPEVADAMEYACSRVGHKGPDATLKYFCGACWGKIKEVS